MKYLKKVNHEVIEPHLMSVPVRSWLTTEWRYVLISCIHILYIAVVTAESAGRGFQQNEIKILTCLDI